MDFLWWCVKAICGAVAVLGLAGFALILFLSLFVGPKSKHWI